MNKLNLLKKIEQEIEVCKKCKVGTNGKPVPGEGDPNADIMFVGEAPGKQEAQTGKPFIGRSGQLLRSLIREIGVDDKKVFITSVGKYLPNSGTPNAKGIEHGRRHLMDQINVLQPKLIVLLGNVAIQGVLQEKLKIGTIHGSVIKRRNIKYFPMFHPAAALRYPPSRKLITQDFQKLKNLIKDIT